MELEPVLRFMCDECETDFEFELTAVAGGGWDDRGILRRMRNDGWLVDGNRHICPDCAEDEG